ncbi:unnamed protein product, partial [Enterobius vermicularis]|uniref:CHK domain-containing protein n=1 Tax=Enterobius vermicularis TaxID=51028 RepID=A0A0N4VG85_ENTVE
YYYSCFKTDITIKWLYNKLIAVYNENASFPSWIAERLSTTRMPLSNIMRVTFRWEDGNMPHSVIVKTPAKRTSFEHRKGSPLFVRTNPFDNLSNSITILLQKNADEEGCGVLLLEDIIDNRNRKTIGEGMTLENVKNLIKYLAKLHALSLSDSKLLLIKIRRGKLKQVSEAHPGCYGEDLTKAICWNLTRDLRRDNLDALLEHYQKCFLEFSQGFTHQNAATHFTRFVSLHLFSMKMLKSSRSEFEPWQHSRSSFQKLSLL